MNIFEKIDNNDIYFIEIVSNVVVINDNYGGIQILDDKFNIIKKIELFEGLKIYNSYVKDNELILYCYENECLIYINIYSFESRIIKLSIEFNDIIFTPFFEWNDNDLFLIDYDNTTAVHINLFKTSVTVMDKNYINKYEVKIQDDWNELKKYLIHKVYPVKNLAILESNHELILYNFKQNFKSKLNVQKIKFHDIELSELNVAQISEEQILLFTGEKYITLKPELEGYVFLRAKFGTIDDITYVFVLMACNYESRLNIIKRFRIEDIQAVNK